MQDPGIQDLAPLMIVLVIVGVIFAIRLAIQVFCCWFLANTLKKVPPSYRSQEPGMVWLLLIPCFSLVWNFFVFPKISESVCHYLSARGGSYSGDGGKGIGFAYCICMAASIVVGAAALAGLVLLILYLVEINKVRRYLDEADAAAFD